MFYNGAAFCVARRAPLGTHGPGKRIEGRSTATRARNEKETDMAQSREEMTEAYQMYLGQRDRFAAEVAQLEANLGKSLSYLSLIGADGRSLASPKALAGAEASLAAVAAVQGGALEGEAHAVADKAREGVSARYAVTQARLDAVAIANGQWECTDETVNDLNAEHAKRGVDWPALLSQAARENGIGPEQMAELEVPAAARRLIAEHEAKVAEAARAAAAPAKEQAAVKDTQATVLEEMSARPRGDQEERWSNRPPSPATIGLIARLTKEGKIPIPVLAKYRENENQLTAHRLLNAYGPRKFKANQPGKTEQAVEQETEPRQRKLAHWPNVNFPAKDVTKVEPLVNKRTGEAIVDRQGQPRYEATVRIPKGVSLDGTDLSGWMFKQAISAKAAEAKTEGRPVNVSFRPGTKLGLFKYEGEGRARRPVADPPAVDDDDKLQALCSAVAKARKEQEAGGEEPHAPKSLARQKARVTPEQPSLFDAPAAPPSRGVGGEER